MEGALPTAASATQTLTVGMTLAKARRALSPAKGARQ